MLPSTTPDPLEELERLKRSFGSQEAQGIPDLIEEAARGTIRDVAALIRFHELLLFFVAYAHSPSVRAKAEETLASFSVLVDARRGRGDDLSALEEAEVSGIAGARLSALFSFGTVRRLARLYPGRLDIGWECFEDSNSKGEILGRFLPLFKEDASVEAHVPHRAWIESAVPKGVTCLEWLLDRVDSLAVPLEQKAEVYDALRLIVRWNLDGSKATRTHLRMPGARAFFHDRPLIHRREVSIHDELNGPPLSASLLTRSEGRAFLDAALTASAVRYRELHGFTFGDPAKVWIAEAGRGIRIYLAGLLGEFRLPLRAYHSGMIFKNGVPVGYFEGLTLFERMEMGFNLYYTFRDGETAWIFARLLHLCRQLVGVTCFSIHPYQIGWHNEEAIESGAFWFYRKLGFRPVQPLQTGLLAREEEKLARRDGYRTPARTLRKFAESPMVYEADKTQPGRWDRFQVRSIGLAVQRAMAANYGGDCSKFQGAATRSVSRALGAEPDDSRRPEFQNLALALSLIADLGRWSGADKAMLLRIMRAKSGSDERNYLKLTQQHERLRKAFLQLGSV